MQEQNELAALQFACKYSIVPNELGYCGKENAFLEFRDFIENPSEGKIAKIRELLFSFYGLHSYLELIAKAGNKKIFDFDVLEAYWLGNELLEKPSFSEIRKTILSLQEFGLPKKIAEQKAFSLPEGALPHHSMHVLHVNFVTKKLAPIIQNLSNCIIQWAEVKAIGPKTGGIKAKGIELKILNKKFVLQEKPKTIENPFSLRPAKGEFVSVHWNNAIEILPEKQLKSLQKTTMKNLDAINEKM